MGNLIFPTIKQKSFLLNPVCKNLEILTLWKKNLLESLISRYSSLRIRNPNLSLFQLEKLFHPFVTKQSIELIFNNFQHSSTQTTVNTFEILAVLITYSQATIEEKVSFSLQVFDFFGNKKINKDAMILICKIFLNGLKQACKNELDAGFLENQKISSYIRSSEEFSSGIITKDQYYLFRIILWIKGNKILYQLFSRGLKPSKKLKILDSFEALSNFKYFKRRNSTDSNSKNSSILPFETTKEDYINLFKLCSNRAQKALAGTLYEKMTAYPKFSQSAAGFFEIFKFKLKTELSLKEFLEVFSKVKVTTVQKRKTRIFSQENIRKKTLLTNIFSKFDTNYDGFIDSKELETGLKHILTVQAVKDLFTEYDFDNNRLLDLNEFLALFMPRDKKLSIY